MVAEMKHMLCKMLVVVIFLCLISACSDSKNDDDIAGGDDVDEHFTFEIPAFDDAEELTVGPDDEIETVLNNMSEFDRTVEMAFRISAAYEYDPENPREDYDEVIVWGDGQFVIAAESSKDLSFSFSDFDFSSFEDGMRIHFLPLVYIYGDNGQKGQENGTDFFVEIDGEDLVMTHSDPRR